MKRIVLVPVLAAASVFAHAHEFVENARVVAVAPQYEQLRVPRQECSRQFVNEPRRLGEPDYGGAVLGGVAGALIGNQVGGGHGREAATAVGAVIGAFTGHDLANRDRWEHTEVVAREVVACRDVEHVQSRLVGYQVTYELRGQQFTTLLHDAPGRILPVRVSVEPVGP
ncbi:MAG: glycine zipper 2TM domain-containing protein [Rhizobacter sp.]|nr:glycine zipper 2TM domain-containing protein [Rhizobacter sp.]